MALNASAGAGAYSAIANLVGNARGEAKTAAPAQGSSEFGDIVESVLANVTKSGNAMEAQAANLSTGNGDVLDLVTAVAETELAVESLVTIRDRVISAYQDILNMPI
ncbi:flagellar hook-basal body protein FliE [bacterium BMS3Bbin10]|nr:flagellar hook-basal body protein FliE [bacterium BMS3Bbin10]HDL17006.1 flagellar hook-basal body complex protein FliE [Hyphomicrobiales bacterium]